MHPTLWAFLTSWNWRPELLLVLGLPGGIYAIGWLRLRQRESSRHTHGRHLALYLTGLVLLGLALLSPLDTFTPLLFFMHMTQHVLLTMLAPPPLMPRRENRSALNHPTARAAGRSPHRGSLPAGSGWRQSQHRPLQGAWCA